MHLNYLPTYLCLPMSVPNAETRSSLYIRLFFCVTINFTLSGVANTFIVTCIVIFHGMFFPYVVQTSFE